MKVAYVFAANMASTYKLSSMILPQLYAALAPNPPDYVITL